MWLAAVALALCGVGVLLRFGFLPWHDGGSKDLGVMSHQWLAEHRAGSR
jgi:hypothetical protein